MMSRQRRLLAWLLLSLCAVALGIAGGAALVRWRGPAQRPPDVGGMGAKEAFVIARVWAQTWQSDAELVNCTTSRRRGVTVNDGWTFQIYSAQRQTIAMVRVQDKELSVLRESPALFSQSPLPLDSWQVDSDDAIATWWSHGGQQVWAHAATEALHLRLGLTAQERLVWQITVSYAQSSALDLWEMAADSGEVLSYPAGREL